MTKETRKERVSLETSVVARRASREKSERRRKFELFSRRRNARRRVGAEMDASGTRARARSRVRSRLGGVAPRRRLLRASRTVSGRARCARSGAWRPAGTLGPVTRARRKDSEPRPIRVARLTGAKCRGVATTREGAGLGRRGRVRGRTRRFAGRDVPRRERRGRAARSDARGEAGSRDALTERSFSRRLSSFQTIIGDSLLCHEISAPKPRFYPGKTASALSDRRSRDARQIAAHRARSSPVPSIRTVRTR